MNESAKKYCENCLSKQIIIHAETINKIIEQCLIEFPSTNTQQLKEYLYQLQSPNQKIPDRKTKCVIETHLNIKQNVIFDANLKPV